MSETYILYNFVFYRDKFFILMVDFLLMVVYNGGRC